jgi:hypothetical protein
MGCICISIFWLGLFLSCIELRNDAYKNYRDG